jgi:hypothetical protein
MNRGTVPMNEIHTGNTVVCIFVDSRAKPTKERERERLMLYHQADHRARAHRVNDRGSGACGAQGVTTGRGRCHFQWGVVGEACTPGLPHPADRQGCFRTTERYWLETLQQPPASTSEFDCAAIYSLYKRLCLRNLSWTTADSEVS